MTTIGKKLKLAWVAALATATAACGQGDSGNVMAQEGNALTPAQVDAALGPELANGGDNQINGVEGNAVEESEAVEAADAAEPRPRAEPQPETEPEPAETPAETPTETTNSSEQ